MINFRLVSASKKKLFVQIFIKICSNSPVKFPILSRVIVIKALKHSLVPRPKLLRIFCESNFFQIISCVQAFQREALAKFQSREREQRKLWKAPVRPGVQVVFQDWSQNHQWHRIDLKIFLIFNSRFKPEVGIFQIKILKSTNRRNLHVE